MSDKGVEWEGLLASISGVACPQPWQHQWRMFREGRSGAGVWGPGEQTPTPACAELADLPISSYLVFQHAGEMPSV